MIDTFGKLIEKASSGSRKGDYEVALEICSKLFEEYPEKTKEILRTVSHIHAHQGHINMALDDRRRILDAGEGDVQDYYFAGSFAAQEALWRDAETYLRDALYLIRVQRTCKYKQDAQFLLAYCLLKNSNADKAREVCSELDDSFEAWIEAESTGFLTVRNLKKMIGDGNNGA